MLGWRRLVSLYATIPFWRGSLAQNHTRHVSTELFNSLEELSRLVDISYCVGTSGVQKPFKCLSHCEEFQNLELITAWSTGVLLSDSCGYVALSHDPGVKRIIVAFRGTYSITNTIIDLSAYPQSYIPYPGNTTESTNNKDDNPPRAQKCENCTVHAGFMSSWINTRETILPHIKDALEKYPDYEVTLVGHSLGGAIAALAGLEMQIMGMNPIVTTFGEPMVGNVGFAKFLDLQFDLEEYERSDLDHDLEKQRFRRVTHIDDPIPLLPLREWGYAPHAGEIFISRPNLPPTIEDVNFCLGNVDARCISGSDSPNHLLDIYQDIDIPLNIFEDEPIDSCSSESKMDSVPGTEQQVIGERSSKCTTTDSTSTKPLYPRGWDWSFIPARYRLWELFYAHRDYFWRIGLCVPGGDPTG
ncbi:hypothetical protein PENSTE_c037G01490 [Penicillium steckii]|uniref:Fungal lipase-type domain-containing protein n=1 Tax=Penicillium steckii TaxID=303698 RepID=A0A1V6SKF4_9EURO|nr:hypothetical protein PENSTE_c037G01490 [Penicillium steckii]